jgi:hypothetical protein
MGFFNDLVKKNCEPTKRNSEFWHVLSWLESMVAPQTKESLDLFLMIQVHNQLIQGELIVSFRNIVNSLSRSNYFEFTCSQYKNYFLVFSFVFINCARVNFIKLVLVLLWNYF